VFLFIDVCVCVCVCVSFVLILCTYFVVFFVLIFFSSKNNLKFYILFIIHVWNNVFFVTKFHNLMICFLEKRKTKLVWGTSWQHEA